MKNHILSPSLAVARRAPLRAERGSAILGIVALMVIVSVLGVTLLTHISGSSEGVLVTDGGNQAFFMAESGARYAISRILQGGEAAATAMDGQRYVLNGGSAFDLAVEVQVQHPIGVTRYCIDATGISNVGTPVERSTLNGYVIDVATAAPVASPVAFPFAVQITGHTTVEVSGSSYIDSYNSADPATGWDYRGQYSNAAVSVDRNTDAASLGWSTDIYGDLYVGAGADTTQPSTIVNRPGNVHGDIVPSPAPSAAAVAPPAEAAEVAAPTSLTSMPGFSTWGTQTITGGNYRVNTDFSTGSADLTLSSASYLQVGDDFGISGGGSLRVNGDFAATVNDVMSIGGGSAGLTVQGSADLRVGNDLTISGGSGMNVSGTLDLDVGDDFEISGGSEVVLGGDADIDVAGTFSLSGGTSLHITGKVVLRVGAGFELGGGSEITFGPEGSLEVYVQSGTVEISSIDINPGETAGRFLIICASAVSDVELSGDAEVYAGIYAPGADVTISGSSELFGAVVGRSLELSGSAALHYDEALQGTSGAPSDDVTILRRFWVAAGE